MSDIKPIKILFVCMGNICRSPTAHGIFQVLVDKQGLNQSIEVDSAGTHGYHTGNPPDPRTLQTASARGIDLSQLQARRFEAEDFIEFDYIIAMDNQNRKDMLAMKPAGSRARLHLMLEFSEQAERKEVPDPYYGDHGFDLVFNLLTDACQGLLHEVRQKHSV